MNEKRLGELTEQEFTGMMDFVLSDEFDQIPASEFFGTLKAMDKMEPWPAKWPWQGGHGAVITGAMDAPERVLVKGHIEGDRFIPHAVEGAKLEGKRIRVNKEAVIEILLEAA